LRYEGSNNCCAARPDHGHVHDHRERQGPQARLSGRLHRLPQPAPRSSDNLLLEEPEKLCGWCHGVLLRGSRTPWGLQRRGTCYTCHLPPHQRFPPAPQTPREGALHPLPRSSDPEAPNPQAPCTELWTAGVHRVPRSHGTNSEKLLKDTRDSLCRGCHPQVAKRDDGSPNATCTARSGPELHGLPRAQAQSRQAGGLFLRKPGSQVCSLCHDTPQTHVPANYGAKMREVRNDCLACHQPHAADNPFLKRPGF